MAATIVDIDTARSKRETFLPRQTELHAHELHRILRMLLSPEGLPSR